MNGNDTMKLAGTWLEITERMISSRAARRDTQADFWIPTLSVGTAPVVGVMERAIFSLTFNLTKTLVLNSDASLVSRFGRI